MGGIAKVNQEEGRILRNCDSSMSELFRTKRRRVDVSEKKD